MRRLLRRNKDVLILVFFDATFAFTVRSFLYPEVSTGLLILGYVLKGATVGFSIWLTQRILWFIRRFSYHRVLGNGLWVSVRRAFEHRHGKTDDF